MLCELFKDDTDIQFFSANNLCSLDLQNKRNAYIVSRISLKQTILYFTALVGL